MVKIHIIAVGKNKDKWVSEGIAHFEKLLARYAKIRWTIVKPVEKASASVIKSGGTESVPKYFNGGIVIALSDSGCQFNSIKFAQKLEKIMVQGRGEINFIIGGPYGLDKTILEKADEVISLSSLTFSHQIVRLVLLEQLFRAFSILKGTDYHK